MSWPALTENVKVVDVWRGNNPDEGKTDRSKGRIDWRRFKDDNPAVEVVIARACGSSSGPDPDFAHNYDAAQAAGFKVAAYLNNNPYMAVSALLEWWKVALGGREPALIEHDCESPAHPANPGGGLAPVSPAAMTKHVRDEGDALMKQWPKAKHDKYSACWWWTPNIVHGWEAAINLWDAHYIYAVQEIGGTWRQAFTFEEIDRLLPIGNNFTPCLPSGFVRSLVTQWQASEYGKLETYTVDGRRITKNIDLGYMLRSYFQQVFVGVITTPPPEVGDPGAVSVEWAMAVDEWARGDPTWPYHGPPPVEA